jgi:formate C-acetyltransferase
VKKESVKLLRDEFFQKWVRSVDTERVEIVTESFFRHIGNPPVKQRALVLKDILEKMTIKIYDKEMFVGNQGRGKRGVPLFPEYGYKWILEQMDDFETRIGDKFKTTEEQKTILRNCLAKWVGYSMDDRTEAITPDPLREVLRFGVVKNENYKMSAPGHMSPDHERLIRRGLSSIISECREKLSELQQNELKYEGIEKTAFYEACIITCEAIIAFSERYADLAEHMAQAEKNTDRKADLLKIAAVCRNIPRNPAKTYHEALQFMWFTQLIMQIEGNGLAICMGRPDQTLLPYYEASLKDGMSREEALLLTEFFYLKCNEIDKVYSNDATRFMQGPSHGQCITLGGVDADGNDCTNDLSLLLLEADYEVRMVQPDIAVRITKNSPEAFLNEIGVCIKAGINKVKVFGDEVVVDSLKPLAPDEAANYSILGCSEPVICGRTNSWGNCGQINLTKCLELALNDGKCMLTGKQMGLHTGDLRNAVSFEDLKDAFEKQVNYFINHLAEYDSILEYCHKNYYPLPFYSIVTQDCIKAGVEFNAGGARYNTSSPLGVGAITAGDSLLAIKTLVFDEKKTTMPQVIEALEADFVGQEPLRQMLLNRAPKFGNDSDAADEMSNYVLHVYVDALGKHKNNRGGAFIGGLYYVTSYIPFGKTTAASADGRKSTMPLNDGGISPSHGMDKKGPTAIAKSVSKLDNADVMHGCVLNQRFHPSVFNGENSFQNFTSYLRGFARLDCFECQYNVVTTETLRKAQKNPESYRGLVVRVAGYSAYFTDLEPEIQEDIISRTEHLR